MTDSGWVKNETVPPDPVTENLAESLIDLVSQVWAGEFKLGRQFEPNEFRRAVEKLIQKAVKDRREAGGG
jgi:hypothetical protein